MERPGLVGYYGNMAMWTGIALPRARNTGADDGKTPEARRIIALMEIYNLPTPTLFAKALKVSQPRLSNVITGGLPLSKELAFKIVERFPSVGLEFLWFGNPGGIKSLELSEKLHDYEQRRGVQLFSRSR